MIKYHQTPCDCQPGSCRHFVPDDEHCIRRCEGELEIKTCAKCSPQGGMRWHLNGECLGCKHEERSK